jgi:hypothetical protein
VARFGHTNSDAFYEVDDLPFKAVFQDFLKSLEERRSTNTPSTVAIWGKFDEKFWMKDSVAFKRFETLVDFVLKPVKVAKKSGRPKLIGPEKPKGKSKQLTLDDSLIDSSMMVPEALVDRSLSVPAGIVNGLANRSDSEDTDEMLAAAAKVIQHPVKRKRKEGKKKAAHAIALLPEDQVVRHLQQLQQSNYYSERLAPLTSMISEPSYHTEYRPDPVTIGYPAEGHPMHQSFYPDTSHAGVLPSYELLPSHVLPPLRHGSLEGELPGVQHFVSHTQESSPPLKRPLSSEELDFLYQDKRPNPDRL